MERSCSVVEHGTLNRGGPGFESALLPFQSLDVFVLSMTPQLTQLYNCVPDMNLVFVHIIELFYFLGTDKHFLDTLRKIVRRTHDHETPDTWVRRPCFRSN